MNEHFCIDFNQLIKLIELIELILKSRRVVSKKLMDEGFQFKYATVENAMDNLIN